MTRITSLFSLLFLLFLVACVRDENPTVLTTIVPVAKIDPATATAVPQTKSPTPTTTSTRLNTPAATFAPTNTPIPYITLQPFPTITPVGVYPTKQVFIQAG